MDTKVLVTVREKGNNKINYLFVRSEVLDLNVSHFELTSDPRDATPFTVEQSIMVKNVLHHDSRVEAVGFIDERLIH